MEENLITGTNLGALGEDEACRFLRKKGFKILDRNYRAGSCEIDVVARDGKLILFVEVKTRSSRDFASPWENVGYRKQKNLKSAAKIYIQDHSSSGFTYRFDVISIVMDDALKAEIEWIQQAF